MADDIETLLKTIAATIDIARSSADWGMKYDLIFKLYQDNVKPARAKLGIDFDWYDPDMGYEDDVRAYVSALEELRDRVIALSVPAEGETEPCRTCGGLGAIRVSEDDDVRRNTDTWRKCLDCQNAGRA